MRVLTFLRRRARSASWPAALTKLFWQLSEGRGWVLSSQLLLSKAEICGILSPDGHAIWFLWTTKDSRQIIDWVFLGSYTTLASSKIVYNRVGSSRLERALAHNFMVSYTYVARNISIAWTFHQYSFHTKKVNECSTLICLLKYPTHEATLGIKLTKGSRVILDFITYLRDPIAVTPSWILLLQLFLDLSATASTYSKLLMDVFYLSVS